MTEDIINQLKRGVDREDAISINEFPIKSLSLSKKAINSTKIDIKNGSKSMTSGPIEVMYNIETKQLLVTDGYHRVVESILNKKKAVPIKIWSTTYSDYHANIPKEDLFESKSNKEIFGLGSVDSQGVVTFKKFPADYLATMTHQSAGLPPSRDRFRYDDGWVEWTDKPESDVMRAVENYLLKRNLPFEKHSSYWGTGDYIDESKTFSDDSRFGLGAIDSNGHINFKEHRRDIFSSQTHGNLNPYGRWRFRYNGGEIDWTDSPGKEQEDIVLNYFSKKGWPITDQYYVYSDDYDIDESIQTTTSNKFVPPTEKENREGKFWWMSPEGKFYNVSNNSHIHWARRYLVNDLHMSPEDVDAWTKGIYNNGTINTSTKNESPYYTLLNMGWLRIGIYEDWLGDGDKERIIEYDYKRNENPPPSIIKKIKDFAMEKGIKWMKRDRANRLTPVNEDYRKDFSSDDYSAKNDEYFKIGQEDEEVTKNSFCWIWSRADQGLRVKQGGTHGMNFSHEIASNTFKGWYDPEKKAISVVFPPQELRKLGDRKPTIDDIPNVVYRKLESRFGQGNKLVVFESTIKKSQLKKIVKEIVSIVKESNGRPYGGWLDLNLKFQEVKFQEHMDWGVSYLRSHNLTSNGSIYDTLYKMGFIRIMFDGTIMYINYGQNCSPPQPFPIPRKIKELKNLAIEYGCESIWDSNNKRITDDLLQETPLLEEAFSRAYTYNSQIHRWWIDPTGKEHDVSRMGHSIWGADYIERKYGPNHEYSKYVNSKDKNIAYNAPYNVLFNLGWTRAIFDGEFLYEYYIKGKPAPLPQNIKSKIISMAKEFDADYIRRDGFSTSSNEPINEHVNKLKTLYVGYVLPDENFKVVGYDAYHMDGHYEINAEYPELCGVKKLAWRYRKDLNSVYWWNQIPDGDSVDSLNYWIKKNTGKTNPQHNRLLPYADDSFKISHEVDEQMFPKEFDRHKLGSCMAAAELATKYLLKKGIKNFKIVEGWVSLSPDLADDESAWETHTWIEFENGKKFDPTRKQWRTWGYDPDGVEIQKTGKKYSPDEYLDTCEWEPSDWKRFKKNINEGLITGRAIVGIIDSNDSVKSAVCKNHDTFHRDFGWENSPVKWAFWNDERQVVSWWYEPNEEQKMLVENYLFKKFSLEIKGHISAIDRTKSYGKSILAENMSYEDLLKLTTDDRKEKASNVNVRSLPVSMDENQEQWNFRYKSSPQTTVTDKPFKGSITFLKGEVDSKDKAAKLECKVDCECPDFMYRFAYNDAAQGASQVGSDSLSGCINRKPQPAYDYGEGLCKHLTALGRFLNTKISATKKSNLFEAVGEVAKQGPFNVTYYD